MLHITNPSFLPLTDEQTNYYLSLLTENILPKKGLTVEGIITGMYTNIALRYCVLCKDGIFTAMVPLQEGDGLYINIQITAFMKGLLLSDNEAFGLLGAILSYNERNKK